MLPGRRRGTRGGEVVARRRRRQPERPLPRPTNATPGSAEKIRVMAERFAAGEQLHSEYDPKIGRMGRLVHFLEPTR